METIKAASQPTQTAKSNVTPLQAKKSRSPRSKVAAPTPFDSLSGRGSGRVVPMESRASADDATSPAVSGKIRPLRLICIGSREDLVSNIKVLHLLRYANAADWSKLQPGPNPGEFMSVVTLRPFELTSKRNSRPTHLTVSQDC